MASEGGLPDAVAAAATLGSAHRVFVTGDAAARQLASDAVSVLSESAQELLPVLLSLVDHADPYVRAGAAGLLSFADPDPRADGAMVDALVRLTSDDDRRVRDWAATSLGGLADVDSPAIRDALRGLLDEPDTTEAYPAAEAAWALAVRGDTGVVQVILARLNDSVGKLWLTAAAATRSPLLLDRLRELTEPDEDLTDPWVLALHDAIICCSPDGSPAREPRPAPARAVRLVRPLTAPIPPWRVPGGWTLAPAMPTAAVAAAVAEAFAGEIDCAGDEYQAVLALGTDGGEFCPAASLQLTGGGTQIVAVCLVQLFHGVPEVSYVATCQTMRRRGAARLALSASLSALQAAGYDEAVLFVHPGNTAARALYTSLGFTPADHPAG